jgi:hypothetical protein
MSPSFINLGGVADFTLPEMVRKPQQVYLVKTPRQESIGTRGPGRGHTHYPEDTGWHEREQTLTGESVCHREYVFAYIAGLISSPLKRG